MKNTQLFLFAPALFLINCAFAEVPVTISGPDESIITPASPGSSQTVHFTLHNTIPSQSVPILGISGLSGFLSQTNNCGSSLGPNQSCTISMTIAPTAADAGSSVSASLNVNYDGRYPACYPSSKCDSHFTVDVSNNLANLIISNSPSPLLMVGGHPKQITISNTTGYSAQNLSVNLSGSALSRVIVNYSSCGSRLAANSSCTVTLTPPQSGTDGAAAGQPAASGTLSVTASNAVANPSSSEMVYLLNYGNIYNDGYVYALADPSVPTVSLTGAVAAKNDLPASAWGAAALSGSSFTDGGYNMYLMLQDGITDYAAAEACYNYLSSDNKPHVWYLPAICELGGSALGVGCSNTGNNMVTELFAIGIGGFQTATPYWSSTQGSLVSRAWSQAFDSNVSSQNNELKSTSHIVRCARSITYPSS